MINKLINYFSQKVRNIRQDRLEHFLKSEDPRIMLIAQDQLDNPSVYDVFIALMILIMRPIHRGFLFILSPLKILFKGRRYLALLDSLSSNDAKERKKTIPKLAEYPNEESLNTLINLLSDESPDIRLVTVETLWKMQKKESIKPITEALKQETDCFNRIMISLCLISMGDTTTLDDLFENIAENSVHNEHWDMTDLDTSSLLKELGSDAIPFLEKGLSHSDWHVRWISLRVIDVLAQNKNEVLGQFVFLGDDPHLELREMFSELFDSA